MCSRYLAWYIARDVPKLSLSFFQEVILMTAVFLLHEEPQDIAAGGSRYARKRFCGLLFGYWLGRVTRRKHEGDANRYETNDASSLIICIKPADAAQSSFSFLV